jgi:hypothetical protein
MDKSADRSLMGLPPFPGRGKLTWTTRSFQIPKFNQIPTARNHCIRPTQVFWFKNSSVNFIKPFIVELVLTKYTKI